MKMKATEKFNFSQPEKAQPQKQFRNKCCKRYVADLHSNTQDYVKS